MAADSIRKLKVVTTTLSRALFMAEGRPYNIPSWEMVLEHKSKLPKSIQNVAIKIEEMRNRNEYPTSSELLQVHRDIAAIIAEITSAAGDRLAMYKEAQRINDLMSGN